MADTVDITNVTALHPKAERRTRSKPDRTNSERQKRFRDKRKALPTVTPEGTVTAPPIEKAPAGRNALVTPAPIVTVAHPTPHVDAPPTATVTRHGAIDALPYVAAIGLAGAAAWFSIRGMVVLFPGAPLAVVGMTVAMETAKLVTTGWLARRWRRTAGVWRVTLIMLVAGLAVINATGVYAQLVAAHVEERGATVAWLETQDAALAARSEMAVHAVADLDRRLGQIDGAIEEAAKRGRTNAALFAMETQRRARAGLASERNEAAGTLAALKAERASLAAQGRQIEIESVPIRYVAELLGTDADSERAIRWLIALMVLTCDPLAIALTAAVSSRR